jgi:hypothetical protein
MLKGKDREAYYSSFLVVVVGSLLKKTGRRTTLEGTVSLSLSLFSIIFTTLKKLFDWRALEDETIFYFFFRRK